MRGPALTGPFRYRSAAFGLTLCTNVELPRLARSSREAADVIIEIDPPAGWAEACRCIDGGRAYRTIRAREPAGSSVEIGRTDGSDPVFRYLYPDGAAFLIGPQGQHVLARTAPGQAMEDTLTYLLGPVMALVVRLKGALCLHGSAVVTGGRAVAFVGPAGVGKSTLAAGFALEGTPVLTEDLLVISAHAGGFVVRPGLPYVRLWPDTSRLPGLAGDLPRLTPNWDKRYLDLRADPCHFHEHSVPLERIYLLERDESARLPDIEAVDGPRALITLIGHLRGSHALTPEERGDELPDLGRLAASASVRRLVVPDDLGAVAEVCERVRRDACVSSPTRAAVGG